MGSYKQSGNASKKRKNRNDRGKKRGNYTSRLPTKYRQYLSRANKKSIAFELTVEEFESILEEIKKKRPATRKKTVRRRIRH